MGGDTTTFDEILPKLRDVFQAHHAEVDAVGPILVNRDLTGRVCIILDEACDSPGPTQMISGLADAIEGALGKHAYPRAQIILFEPELQREIGATAARQLPGCGRIYVADRLASGEDWTCIAPPSGTPPRVAFFSAKGGVGRSTALGAVSALLAQAGQRILAVDLDLESPGLTYSLLPGDRRPRFGITDWAVEDLADNSAAVLDDMSSFSPLGEGGELRVVPAHGGEPGEYIAKLGRLWVGKTRQDGSREPWSTRLARLVAELESRARPDVTLIDSRAGLDDIAAAALATLGPSLVLLFATASDQSWDAYRILFKAWGRAEKMGAIRERLQVVGAMMPQPDDGYSEALLQGSWSLFLDHVYDEQSPASGQTAAALDQGLSFDLNDQDAPHFPWPIRWERGLSGLKNLWGLKGLDRETLASTFAPLANRIAAAIGSEGER